MGSGEPEDEDSESEEGKLPRSGSGKPEDEKPESEANELLRSGTDGETKEANSLPQKILKVAEMLASSSSRSPHGNNGDVNVNIRLDPLGNQGVDTKSGTGGETTEANGLPLKIYKVAKMLTSSGSHWSGNPVPRGNDGDLNVNIRLDPLGNQGVHTKKAKRNKSETESEGAVVSVLIMLFIFGALLVVLMMAAFFSFAW